MSIPFRDKGKDLATKNNVSLKEVIQIEAKREQRKNENAHSIDIEAGMEEGVEVRGSALFRPT